MSYHRLKIGIFTITGAINYGAFYQMYALSKYFKGLGATVSIYHESNSIKRKIIKYFSFNIQRQLRKIKVLNVFNADGKELDIKKYTGEELDIAILGSDEIWNLQNNSFDHSSFYYGKGISAKRIIAYAPSIGFADPKIIYANQDFCNGLKKIDVILARDNSTKEIAEKITGKSVNIVSDPTILFNEWNTVKLNPSLIGYDYILYYGYTRPPYLSSLLEFSKIEKLPIISAGYHLHPWCDKNMTVGPIDFLGLLKDAKYVFTTTFHGTVMATLYNKKFCYFASGQKVKDFAYKLNLLSQHIDDNYTASDIKKALETSHGDLDILIKKYMNESRTLLRNAIK